MAKKKGRSGPRKVGFHRKKNTKKGNFVVRDTYTIKAQKAGFRARSIYKLEEIQEKFNLIQKDQTIIDIGCAPGSFLQFIAQIVKEQPIIGVDIKEVKKLNQKNVHTIVCDIFETEKLKEILKTNYKIESFDLITSDIAPNTTGRFDVDQYASVELNIAICQFSDIFLKKGANMLLKVFQGEDFYELTAEIKKRFTKMTTYKPMACRDSSRESYVICVGKK